ncbi:siderophore ABC transporter substrate-binding protein [Lederbergia wuyishanensis]|uniref:Iron complex transport system substrate-binding protein n=1 Tax=Lederbergia wuyishanensis TaxID=1347903 RepID=A0ABU0D4N2_9BACI|nr:siderophore ABC transporter substrate-binding protein [Lederbergia wuyishanensis]MCJ8008053.1 siderophore ABC transporter substrate-binding protein [Lederbergia wuyishanensis]MDQ0343362.1 iron complex transport system substrate-binding protein [Lederbergia wuyishanensis]
MRKIFSIFVISALMIIISACGTNTKDSNENTGAAPSEELTIKHQLDETKVKKNPEKVIVFDFGSLDTLDKLGIEPIALPKTNIPKYLAKYEDEKYENVGSLKEPDFEKIHSLKPDLIIISGRQMELYDEFKAIAPTIFLGVDTEKYMESFESNARTIGNIFDKEDEVNKELSAIEESIKTLNEKASSLDGKSLVVLANEGKVSAYGPKSRFGIIHDVFGFAPVDDSIEVSTHGQSINFEYIVEKNPDYLFVVDRGAAVDGKSSAKQIVENDMVKKSNAYKNGKIIYLDPDYWYLSGGGLESVSSMVKEVESALE